MDFTPSQISKIIEQTVCKEDGLNTILKLTLEALMKAERTEYKHLTQDYSNGYRSRKAFGNKQMLELQVPRTRNGGFYPVVLGLLKNQEQEARSLAFYLYKSGLTTEQVGDVFEEIYGKHYSSSQVSRMFDLVREEVSKWLNRPLESYYPIVYIDSTFIPTRRVDSVSKEAYYTLLAVCRDRTREVLGVFNFPTEGSKQWEAIFERLKNQGLSNVGLFVTDGLTNIEEAIWKHFRSADIQLCTVHLHRVFLKEVKPKHKAALSEGFREVFRSDDRNDTIEAAKQRFSEFCDYWGKYYPYFKRRKNNARNELYFTYILYDHRIRSMIYSTNWVERLNRDFKRTTRMRGALPNPEATILLLAGVAMSRKAYQRKVPKLNYEEKKFKWDD